MTTAPSDAHVMAMLEAQAAINSRLARINYHLLGSGVLLAVAIGIIQMVRTGSRCFHYGWFLYGKAPEERTYQVMPKKTLSPDERQVGVLRQVYNNTFLQNVPLLKDLTIGQATLCSSFFGMILILSIISNPVPWMNPRRYGYLAAVNIPFLVLFSIKNSPLALRGKGYEKLNFLHRFIGYVFILCALVHGGLMTNLAAQGAIQNRKALYSGYFIGLVLILVGLASSPYVRKNFYQTFYVFHVLGYVTVFVGVMYHQKTFQPYIISAILLHSISSGWQVLKWRMITATLTPLPGKITKVEIPGIQTGWKAGQHVRVRILGDLVQGIQAHPFTIASSASKGGEETSHMVLYVKAVGDFTTMLYAKAVTVNGFKDADVKSVTNRGSATSHHAVTLPSNIRNSFEPKKEKTDAQSCIENYLSNTQEPPKKPGTSKSKYGYLDGAKIDVHLEGPYGGIGWKSMDEFKDVFLCAGGSGISFLLAIVSEVVCSAKAGGRTERLLVIYTVREWDVAKYFAEVIQEQIDSSSQCGLSLDVRFFVTTKIQEPTPLGSVKLQWHRPQVDVLLKEFLIDVNDGQGVGCVACGPLGLMTQVRNAVAMVDMETVKRVGGIEVNVETLGW